MTAKKDRIQRLVKVQKQLEQIASRKLQEEQRKAQNLKDQEVTFLRHMGDHNASGQQLAPILSKRLSSVMREHAVQKTSVSSQEASLRTQSMRLRGLERLRDKRDVIGKRAEADQELANVVETATGRKLTRLP